MLRPLIRIFPGALASNDSAFVFTNFSGQWSCAPTTEEVRAWMNDSLRTSRVVPKNLDELIEAMEAYIATAEKPVPEVKTMSFRGTGDERTTKDGNWILRREGTFWFLDANTDQAADLAIQAYERGSLHELEGRAYEKQYGSSWGTSKGYRAKSLRHAEYLLARILNP